MPELPEVEVARRQLARWAAGQRIVGVRVEDPTVIRAGEAARLERVVGAVAGEALRHGKRLGWALGELGLVVHLGMSGAWTRGAPVPRHARLGLGVESGWIWLVDPRRFGSVQIVDARELETALRAGLGPDALLEPLDGPGLAARFGGRGAIKPALLDQARLAGIGNIQATESLWRAGVAPQRAGASLSSEAWDRLARALVEQLVATIEVTDGEEVHYVTAGGPNPFAVYGREGAPCPRCGGRIVRQKQAGRATFHCPVCQPA